MSKEPYGSHIKRDPTYFYCQHCGNMKRIYLSTKIEEENSWLFHHAKCQPSKSLTYENWSFSAKDYQGRTKMR